MPLRAKIILTGLAFAAVLVVVRYLDYVGRSIRDYLVTCQAAGMVVEHMKTNDDQWPASWDDLEDDYETETERHGTHCSFEQLKSRTIVNWDVDVDELRQSAINSDAPEFRVIRASSEIDNHVKGEPNRIVWEYLRSSSSEQ